MVCRWQAWVAVLSCSWLWASAFLAQPPRKCHARQSWLLHVINILQATQLVGWQQQCSAEHHSLAGMPGHEHAKLQRQNAEAVAMACR